MGESDFVKVLAADGTYLGKRSRQRAEEAALKGLGTLVNGHLRLIEAAHKEEPNFPRHPKSAVHDKATKTNPRGVWTYRPCQV